MHQRPTVEKLKQTRMCTKNTFNQFISHIIFTHIIILCTELHLIKVNILMLFHEYQQQKQDIQFNDWRFRLSHVHLLGGGNVKHTAMNSNKYSSLYITSVFGIVKKTYVNN